MLWNEYMSELIYAPPADDLVLWPILSFTQLIGFSFQALHKKQYLTPSEQWNKSPDAPMNLNHEDQSSGAYFDFYHSFINLVLNFVLPLFRLWSSLTDLFGPSNVREIGLPYHLTLKLTESTSSLSILDKWNTSSSSRVEDDCHDGGRGKRKRKPKVHFDVSCHPHIWIHVALLWPRYMNVCSYFCRR